MGEGEKNKPNKRNEYTRTDIQTEWKGKRVGEREKKRERKKERERERVYKREMPFAAFCH